MVVVQVLGAADLKLCTTRDKFDVWIQVVRLTEN